MTFQGLTVQHEGVAYQLTDAQWDDVMACVKYSAGSIHGKTVEGKLLLRGSTLGAHGHLIGVLDVATPRAKTPPIPVAAAPLALAPDNDLPVVARSDDLPDKTPPMKPRRRRSG